VRRPPGSGKRDQERGLESELRVVEACRLPTRPPWMTKVRRATRIEDNSGIDVVVESDVGTLLIQVKSSNLGKKHFRPRAFLGIALVVVRPGDTPEALLKKVVGELEPVRALRLEARRNWRARLVERRSPPPPPRAPPAKSTRAAAPAVAARTAAVSKEPSPARAPGVHWIEIRDAVLAVLLRRGPGRAHTEAELRPTLKTASLDELIARHPSHFVRHEDGTVQAAIGLADAYALRLARCWEPLPRPVLRQLLTLLTSLLAEIGEPVVASELAARLIAAAREQQLSTEQVERVLRAVRRADGWEPVRGAGSPKALVRPREWLRDAAQAEARLDEAARAAMGPFLPLDEEAWAAALGYIEAKLRSPSG